MKMEKAVIKILEELDKSEDEFTKKDKLKKIKIGKNKLEEVLNYLSHKRLITYGNAGPSELRISPAEGRDYLLSYRKEKSQHEFNKMVAFTGSIVALIGIYNFIKEDFGYSQLNFFYIKILFLLSVLACTAPLVKFIVNYWEDEVLGR